MLRNILQKFVMLIFKSASLQKKEILKQNLFFTRTKILPVIFFSICLKIKFHFVTKKKK